jgi:hypothetical protein
MTPDQDWLEHVRRQERDLAEAANRHRHAAVEAVELIQDPGSTVGWAVVAIAEAALAIDARLAQLVDSLDAAAGSLSAIEQHLVP